MAIERERGISITSTVLAFPYRGYQVNLLDTPGHQDFSEDTYRTLTAVDSAVMVLDAARGIEPQTLKLFEVCRMRRTPIFTFINKLDRPAAAPARSARRDRAGARHEDDAAELADRRRRRFPRASTTSRTRTVHLFERTEHGAKRAPVDVAALDDRALDSAARRGAGGHGCARRSSCWSMAGTPFDLERVLAGELTPVCFGSALTNFGVELFLEHVRRATRRRRARATTSEPIVSSRTTPEFSGFVFKIQANMDPRHRDRVAFLRVCSGRFAREMEVWHPRLKRKVRLAPPLRLFGQEREVVEEAYAGDVVGVINPGVFAIGDTVSESDVGTFPPLPRFQPEHFALLRSAQTDRYKQFLKGLTQIEEEGAIQLFYPVASGRREPILAAVGALQFDVVRSRLESEYNVETILEPLTFSAVRWVEGDPAEIANIGGARGRMRAEDRHGAPVILFSTTWDLRYAEENATGVTFSETHIDAIA